MGDTKPASEAPETSLCPFPFPSKSARISQPASACPSARPRRVPAAESDRAHLAHRVPRAASQQPRRPLCPFLYLRLTSFSNFSAIRAVFAVLLAPRRLRRSLCDREQRNLQLGARRRPEHGRFGPIRRRCAGHVPSSGQRWCGDRGSARRRPIETQCGGAGRSGSAWQASSGKRFAPWLQRSGRSRAPAAAESRCRRDPGQPVRPPVRQSALSSFISCTDVGREGRRKRRGEEKGRDREAS